MGVFTHPFVGVKQTDQAAAVQHVCIERIQSSAQHIRPAAEQRRILFFSYLHHPRRVESSTKVNGF